MDVGPAVGLPEAAGPATHVAVTCGLAAAVGVAVTVGEGVPVSGLGGGLLLGVGLGDMVAVADAAVTLGAAAVVDAGGVAVAVAVTVAVGGWLVAVAGRGVGVGVALSGRLVGLGVGTGVVPWEAAVLVLETAGVGEAACAPAAGTAWSASSIPPITRASREPGKPTPSLSLAALRPSRAARPIAIKCASLAAR